MDKAMEAIAAQQKKVQERSAPWMVGEQLKDMLRREPALAELIAQDLTTGGMSLTAAEREIKKFADGHKTGGFACVTPAESEEIIRNYFGLPERSEEQIAAAPAGTRNNGGAEVINLADFF